MTETAAEIIWMLGIVAWVVIRIPHRRRARRTKVTVDKKSTGERFALGLCIAGLVAIPALHIATDWFSFANYPFQPIAMLLGALAMLGFLILFYYSHKQVGKNWSVTLELREDHKLIQHGLYKYMRHPMYTSFWLWGLSQTLLLPNWIAGLTGILAVAWLYFSRIDKEENMMREQFGGEYELYCSRTKRLIPGVL